MFLNYFALFIILTVLVVAFYTFIYIHELPYEAAKHRNHPQQDAIYVACWLSLFTLHAIWPLVFLWALSHKEENPNPGLGNKLKSDTREHPGSEWADRFSQLESRLKLLEASVSQSKKGTSV